MNNNVEEYLDFMKGRDPEVNHPTTIDDIILQCVEDSANWFPETEGDIPFLLLAMLGEVGEAANLVKKVMRGSKTWLDIDPDLREELIDAFIYLMNLFGELNVDVVREYQRKRTLNAERFGSRPSALKHIETVETTGEML